MILGVLTVCIILLSYIYYIYLCHPILDSIHYEHISKQNRFKTGDLILFHALDNINPIFIGSYYGHIGIVYVNPDDPQRIPYIFEANSTRNLPILDRHNKRGIFLSPLENRVRKYKGYVFYKELSGKVPEYIVRDFSNFIKYALENMYYEDRILYSGAKKAFGEKLGNNTNCAELVLLSLIKLGILDINNYNKSSWHYLRWVCSIKNLDNGMHYYDPIYIIDHPF